MTTFLGRIRPSSVLVRMIEGRVSAGFPSPADDYAETYLSLDELVNVRAPSVYLGRTRRIDQRGIDDRALAQRQPSVAQIAIDDSQDAGG